MNANAITLGNPMTRGLPHDPMMYESPTEADESRPLSEASTSSLSSPQSVSSLILRDFTEHGPRMSDEEEDEEENEDEEEEEEEGGEEIKEEQGGDDDDEDEEGEEEEEEDDEEEGDDEEEEEGESISVNPAARAAAIAAAAINTAAAGGSAAATATPTSKREKKPATLTASGKRKGRPPKQHTGLTPPPPPGIPKRRGRPPNPDGIPKKPKLPGGKRGRPPKPKVQGPKIPKKRGRPFKDPEMNRSYHVHKMLDMMEEKDRRKASAGVGGDDDDVSSVVNVDHAKRKLEFEHSRRASSVGRFDISGYGGDNEEEDDDDEDGAGGVGDDTAELDINDSDDDASDSAMNKRRKLEPARGGRVRNMGTQTVHNVVIIGDSAPSSPVARIRRHYTPPPPPQQQQQPASKFSVRSAEDIAALKAKVVAETKAAKHFDIVPDSSPPKPPPLEDDEDELMYSDDDEDGSEKNLDEVTVNAIIGKAFVLSKDPVTNVSKAAAASVSTPEDGGGPELKTVIKKRYLVSCSSWEQKPDGTYYRVHDEDWRDEEELLGDWGCGGYIADFERKYEEAERNLATAAATVTASPSSSKSKKR